MFSAEGPLAAEKSSFIAAGRYVDFKPLQTFFKSAGIPKMYDVFGKVAILAGEHVDVSATGIVSNSTYRLNYPFVLPADNGYRIDNEMNQKERIDQGGAGISLRYCHGAISHKVNVSLSYRKGINADSLTNFNDSFYTSSFAHNPVTQLNDSRRHLMIFTKSILPLFGDNSLLEFGIRVNRNDYLFSLSDQSQHSGDYIFCTNSMPDTLPWELNPNQKSIHFGSLESGAFLEHCYRSNMLEANVGLRTDYYSLLKDFALSPRLSGSLSLGNAGTFSSNLGLYQQFPTDMPSFIFYFFSQKSTISNDSLNALEKTFMGYLQPFRCWQGSCGFEHKFFGTLETRIEAYGKWYDREYRSISPTYKDIFTIDKNGNTALQNQDGKRKAYGVELSIKNRHDRRLFYSLSGSCLDVKNKYKDCRWYNDWTNVGYTFSIDIGSTFRKRHMLSVSLRGNGGLPLCDQLIQMDCIGRKYTVLDTTSLYFSQRLKNLVFANVRYAYTTKIGGLEFDGFIEVLNIFNYQPTLEYKFNGDRFVEVKPFGFSPILGFTVYL